MNIFFDFEMTGLHQKTTPVSLGCIAEDGRELYAEFTDYDREQVFPWLEENVLANLGRNNGTFHYPDRIGIVGDRRGIGEALRLWLAQFDRVELWGDCLPYDWVLFCELFEAEDTAERLPRNVFYIPFDICTLFKIKGIDPDISRLEFSELTINFVKHNALDDARVIQACYDRLMRL